MSTNANLRKSSEDINGPMTSEQWDEISSVLVRSRKELLSLGMTKRGAQWLIGDPNNRIIDTICSALFNLSRPTISSKILSSSDIHVPNISEYGQEEFLGWNLKYQHPQWSMPYPPRNGGQLCWFDIDINNESIKWSDLVEGIVGWKDTPLQIYRAMIHMDMTFSLAQINRLTQDSRLPFRSNGVNIFFLDFGPGHEYVAEVCNFSYLVKTMLPYEKIAEENLDSLSTYKFRIFFKRV